MQKLRFFLLLMLLPSILYAQQRTKINLLGSETINIDNKTKITHIKKPIFEHGGAIFTCDSARLWSELNYFEGLGNVHINQDTINIYSDLLNYDGNAKMAHLMNNVKMSDPSSVLTTNIFDYNMVTKVGTYIQDGKIVNKDKETTITSKKGSYFSSSKDAYFKSDVLVLTKQATITSDSLRYNTFTNQTYFYGPTNIKGKDDNLYTENGEYNTKSEKAFFGKKNLYTQGTKALKGDSLYYDGKVGYGKAVKNIIFTDSEDKLELRAQLGEYYKKDERIIATKNAYLGMGTSDSVTVNEKLIPDTLWLGADVLEAQMSLQSKLKLVLRPTVLADDEVGVEEEKAKAETEKEATPEPATSTKAPAPKPEAKETSKKSKKDKRKGVDTPTELTDSTKISVDSLKTPVDSTSLRLKISAKKDSLSKDSLIKSQKLAIKDTLKLVPKINDKANLAKITPKKEGEINSKLPANLNKPVITKDSLPFNPADTVRTRTIKAHYNVKVFKTNLQAKSDSLFFTAADSTLRLYQKPILWSDSSQQTGDTIHIQFKNKKINSAQILQNAFIAKQETDTAKFNQIKGKIITVFFNDGEIKNMYVDGNAESIYFDRKPNGEYQQNQTISARIRIIFDNKEISRVKTVKGIEGTFSPPEKESKESILTGFIWKPSLRPKSKNDVINGTPPPKDTLKPSGNVIKPKTTPKTKAKSSSTKPLPTAKTPATGAKNQENDQKKDTPVKEDSTKTTPKPIDPVIKLDTTKKTIIKLDTTKKS